MEDKRVNLFRIKNEDCSKEIIATKISKYDAKKCIRRLKANPDNDIYHYITEPVK